MCLRCLRLPRRLRSSRLVGRTRPAAATAASTLVVNGLTQALQLVDQRCALRAYPVAIALAIALAVPSLRRALEARVIVDVTHG
jgi:hypothetical protein